MAAQFVTVRHAELGVERRVPESAVQHMPGWEVVPAAPVPALKKTTKQAADSGTKQEESRRG